MDGSDTERVKSRIWWKVETQEGSLRVCVGRLKSGGCECPALEIREWGAAIFTLHPTALIDSNELNSTTKWRTKPLHQAPPL